MTQLLRLIGISILILLLQTVLLQLVSLDQFFASPKLFPLIILLMPFTLPRWAEFLTAFVLGLVVDGLMQWPMGGSGFTLVLMVLLRRFWLIAITRQPGSELFENLNVERESLNWQLIYLLPLTATYELAYRILIDFGLQLSTLYWFAGSTLYSAFVQIIFVILILKRNG